MTARTLLFSPQQWLVLVSSFIMMGLFTGFHFIYGIFLNPLIAEFGWARSTTSAAYSINMFMIAASAMVTGGLADRHGTRPIVIAGTLVAGAGLVGAHYIQNLWQYYLFAGIFVGLGRSAIMAPVQAYIQRSFEKNRGLATGLAGSGSGLGIVILAPLSGYLVATTGWRTSFLILGAGFLAIALPAALMLRERKQGEPAADAPAKSAPASAVRTNLLPEASQGMATIVKRRPFWMVFGSHTTDCACHSVLIVHLVPIAIEAGIPRVQAAGLMGALGVGAILGRVLVGLLADRIGAKRALFATLTTQTLPVIFLLWTKSPVAFYAIAALVGLGLGGHGTMYPFVTREFYGPKRVGLLFGTFAVGASTGMASGGFIGGLLHDLSGDYTLSILFSLAAGIVSLLLVLFYPSQKRQPSPLTGPAAEVSAQPTL